MGLSPLGEDCNGVGLSVPVVVWGIGVISAVIDNFGSMDDGKKSDS